MQKKNKHNTQSKRIPSSLRQAVWLAHNGKRFEKKCKVSWCTNTINVFNFEAGHDIPETKGGATNLENLKPICTACNKSMGNKYTIAQYSKIVIKRPGILSYMLGLFK